MKRFIFCSGHTILLTFGLFAAPTGCIVVADGNGPAKATPQGDAGAQESEKVGSPSRTTRIPDWDEETDAGADASVPPPFERPLETLVTQAVPWGGLGVSVTGARVMRGIDERILPEITVAALDFEIENYGSDEVDYTARNTWDLLLADGQRLFPENRLGFVIAPASTVKATHYYVVSEDAVLEDAALILEGSERGTLEPEIIPLDEPWEAQYPRRINSLAGKVVQPPTDHYNWQKYEIVDALVELNDEDHLRAHLGKRFVRLDVVATAGGTTASNIIRPFRIVIDGRSYEPIDNINELVRVGNSVNLPVVFAVEKDTTKFEIDIKASTDGYVERLPVDLEKDATTIVE